MSRKSYTNCGSPQGSCLGSLLFIFYIRDLENVLESMTSNMYADDTNANIALENRDKTYITLDEDY